MKKNKRDWSAGWYLLSWPRFLPLFWQWLFIPDKDILLACGHAQTVIDDKKKILDTYLLEHHTREREKSVISAHLCEHTSYMNQIHFIEISLAHQSCTTTCAAQNCEHNLTI